MFSQFPLNYRKEELAPSTSGTRYIYIHAREVEESSKAAENGGKNTGLVVVGEGAGEGGSGGVIRRGAVNPADRSPRDSLPFFHSRRRRICRLLKCRGGGRANGSASLFC